jgi:hypothetical protein
MHRVDKSYRLKSATLALLHTSECTGHEGSRRNGGGEPRLHDVIWRGCQVCITNVMVKIGQKIRKQVLRRNRLDSTEMKKRREGTNHLCRTQLGQKLVHLFLFTSSAYTRHFQGCRVHRRVSAECPAPAQAHQSAGVTFVRGGREAAGD